MPDIKKNEINREERERKKENECETVKTETLFKKNLLLLEQ